MKTNYYKHLVALTALLTLMSSSVFAYDFMVDNIAYRIISSTELTCETTTGSNIVNQTVNIPATVTYKGKELRVIGIGDGSFDHLAKSDKKIKYLTIAKGITYIGERAFCWNQISEIVIPNTVVEIRPEAFHYAHYTYDNLNKPYSLYTKLIIEDGTSMLYGTGTNLSVSLDYPFRYTHLYDVYIGRSINKNLLGDALYSIQYLEIGDKVTYLSEETFTPIYLQDSFTALEELTIGKGLNRVPYFKEGSNLRKVYVRSRTPQPSGGFESSTYVNATLYVPRGTKSLYQNASVWNKFWTIEEYDVKTNDIILTASPNGGEVGKGTCVKLTASPEDSEIYYTTDGTEPTKNSIPYTSSGVTISKPLTLRAVAYKDNYDSGTLTEKYTLKRLPLTASQKSGEVMKGSKVYLQTTDSKAEIRYTVDGSTPTKSSLLYTQEGIVINKAMTLKAIAFDSDGDDSLNSNILTEYYTVFEGMIVESNHYSGKIVRGTYVKLSCTTPDADIYYTTNGSTPTRNSEQYIHLEGINVYNKMTIKAIAYHPEYPAGEVLTLDFTITDPLIFKEKNSDGVEIMYNVTDFNEKTCEVYGYTQYYPNPNVPAIDSSLSGNITIPSTANGYTVTGLSKNSLRECENITSVTLPTTVKSIGSYAFYNCKSLKELKGVDQIEQIGHGAFENTKLMDSYSSGMIYFGKVAYTYKNPGDMPSNTAVKIKEGTKSITEQAIDFDYSYINKIESLYIPSSVEDISGYIVSNGKDSRYFTSIIVDEDNKKYDSRDGCNAIIEKTTKALIQGCKNTKIPETVKIIQPHAFNHAEVDEMSIPNSVEEISQKAFFYSSIQKIIIGSGMKEIGFYAFIGCEDLKTIYISCKKPCNLNYAAFEDDTFENATLYVPTGSKALYQSAESWKKFKNIVELESLGINGVNVKDDNGSDNNVYNLRGQRLSTPQKGLNIINGKKVVVK